MTTSALGLVIASLVLTGISILVYRRRRAILAVDAGHGDDLEFAERGKLRLDVAALLRSPGFRAANQDFTSRRTTVVSMSGIKLPAGTRLCYLFDPRHDIYDHPLLRGLSSVQRARSNLDRGMPGFVGVELTQPTTARRLAFEAGRDRCIVAVALDDVTFHRGVRTGHVDRMRSPDKRVADQVIAQTLAANRAATMVVIGIRSDLAAERPELVASAGRPGPPRCRGCYPLETTAADGSTRIVQVDVASRGFTIPTPGGVISVSAISNAIISTALRGAELINVTIPTFDRAIFQPAIDVATRRGAVVVHDVPIPSATVKAAA